jgi:hypothetical protein
MNGQPAIGANLSFTKFLFIAPHRDDDSTLMRVRAAGATIGRGFFNDFDADGVRDVQPQETIQFLVTDGPVGSRAGLGAARYVAQVSANYRPRLQDVQIELQRRIGDAADIIVVNGAERALRYSSAEMYSYAYKRALPRPSGRAARNAIILPINKTPDWWKKTPLERHVYFYPHHDADAGLQVKGHAGTAEAGIPTIYRRLYHNPDGYQREHEFDFVTYFECGDEHVPVFDQICRALRDERQSPEWRYVLEAPAWRGRRVLRW